MGFKWGSEGEWVSDAVIAKKNEKIKDWKCDVCGGIGGHVNEETHGGYGHGEALCDHCGADLEVQSAIRHGQDA